MQLLVDPHTHTIASTHAYSTIMENAKAAARRGIKLLGITDHAPALEDAPHVLHFQNLHVLDRELYGVKMLYGAELNICDYKGRVDLDETVLKNLDYGVASFHTVLLKPGSKKENTRAMLGAMNNPYVKIIGHPEDGSIPVDYLELVKNAKKTKTMLEVNNSSLKTAYYRLNVRENLINMLQLCEKYGVPISVGSDAHFANAVGNFDCAIKLLEEISFPEELVANTSVEKFLKLLGERWRYET
ncbi:MAG: phosphatase [Thermoanaerobacteraceae bacterium]|nr:phosphatase [Thermoanaerobacteraceae bacterium]